MTHQTNPELLNTVLQLLSEVGSGGFAEGIRLLVNEAMRQERGQALQAQPEKGLLPRDLAVRDPAKYRAPPSPAGRMPRASAPPFRHSPSASSLATCHSSLFRPFPLTTRHTMLSL